MLKSLYPSIDWDDVRIVGCDMDGTLYDEADFISQAYRPIAKLLTMSGHENADILHSWMFQRWLEKGSSYPHIFYEATSEAGVPKEKSTEMVEKCLDVFRTYRPELTLSHRVKTILDKLSMDYPLFLVTDGSVGLQQRKFDSLGLSRWFDYANVGISGYFGKEYCKPNLKVISHLQVLKKPYLPRQIVYFGDRVVDAEFAANAGFQFVQVANMHFVKLS